MINSKTELNRYLKMDKIALGRTKKHPTINDFVWKYEIALRKHEYYVNCTNNKIMRFFYKYKHYYLGIMLGFEIPINTFGGGA